MGTTIFIEIENIVNKDVVWLSFQLNDTHKNVCSSNQGLITLKLPAGKTQLMGHDALGCQAIFCLSCNPEE